MSANGLNAASVALLKPVPALNATHINISAIISTIIVPMIPHAVFSAELITAVSFHFVIDPLNSQEAHPTLTVVTDIFHQFPAGSSIVVDVMVLFEFPNMVIVHAAGVQSVLLFAVLTGG